MKKSYRGFPIYALLILCAFFAAQMFTSSLLGSSGAEIEYGKMLEYIQDGVIAQIALEEDTVYARSSASTIKKEQFSKEAYDFMTQADRDTFIDTCRQLAARRNGVPVEAVTELDLGFELIYLPDPEPPIIVEILPYIVMTGALMLFWMFIMRQQGGGGKMMNFGHSTARIFEPDGNRITFADVAGAVEEKEEMQELVEFLKNPRRFTKVGARIPKGVLLVGPPGTGK
ncbi:MAG: hypothetical protein IJ381_07580, partial [Clostridia bacterium]|nr:hypothetical protein [Clostridia bacterium]